MLWFTYNYNKDEYINLALKKLEANRLKEIADKEYRSENVNKCHLLKKLLVPKQYMV